MPAFPARLTAKTAILLLQSVAMLRNITTFHTVATAAVERTAGAGGDGSKITYNVIKARLADLLYKITSQKFEDPSEGEAAIKCAALPIKIPPVPLLSPCPFCAGCSLSGTSILPVSGETTSTCSVPCPHMC
jgi:hypothetical protein